MASKVNTKFVVLLGGALALAFAAVVWIAYESIRKSGDDYIVLGDQAMAEKKYTEAVGLYGRAVFKDQRNPAWISKWIEAMEHEVPSGRAVYTEQYFGQYWRALQALAEASPSDYAANRRWIDERWEVTRMNASVASLEQFVKFAEETVQPFRGTPEETKRLRRYRGLAVVALLARTPDLKAEELQAARADLEGALEGDPADKDAMISLCALDVAEAERARRLDDHDKSKALHDAAMARVIKFIDDHPPAASARILELTLQIQRASEAATEPVRAQDVLQDRQARVEELIAAVKAEKPENIDAAMIRNAMMMARMALPHERGRDAAAELMNLAMTSRPDDVAMIDMAARVDIGNDEFDAALAKLQRIVDMPDRPMSREGWLLFDQRAGAIRAQTDVAFRIWEQPGDPEKKAAAAAMARKFRNDFVARVGEANNAVLAIDARLALISGDVKGATTLLSRYNQQTNETDVPSMALQGRLMLNQGNMGAAKQAFERVLQGDADNLQAHQSLARIADANQEWGAALRHTQAALKSRPDDAGLKEQQGVYQQLVSGGRIEDPVVRILFEAQQQAAGVGGDEEASIRIIRDGLAAENGKHAGDVRLHIALVQKLARRNDKDALLAAIDAALVRIAEGPMADNFRRMRESVTTEDPVARALENINKSEVPELAKHLGRYQVLMRGERAEEAAAALAAAKALAPEDPQVVDFLFDDALKRDDKAELTRLADLAASKNLDQVNGQLFRARLMTHERKFSEAAVELRGVLERDRLNFMAWRLLGIVQMNLNDAEAAVLAFRKAVEIRPRDATALNGLLHSLTATGRLSEGLTAARAAELWAGQESPEFVELLIDLETRAPDGNKQRAMEFRERIAQTRPGDTRNVANLALLQIEQRQWALAKSTIDLLRGDEANADMVVQLDARWYAAQGKFAEAEKVYDDAIAVRPKDKLDEGPYLAAAALFTTYGQFDRAIAYLEKGRPVQRKDRMLIDRQLGDVCFNAMKREKAVEAYQAVLDAGSPDENNAVAKRLLECYLTLEDWARFDQQFAQLGEAARGDSTVLVLAAEAAAAQQDKDRAARLYDQAVSADQKNFIVFLKRADFSRNDPTRLRDSIADYDHAARLAPGSKMPPLRLAQLYRSQNRHEEAIAQLDRALTIDPADDALREELINYRGALGQRDEVVGLIDQAIKLKPDNVRWLIRAGQVASELGRTEQSIAHYARAWQVEKSLPVAIPYVTALIMKQPPDLNEAMRVVNHESLKSADEVPRHLLSAMVRARSRTPADADRDTEMALSKLDQTNPSQVELFLSGIESIYGEQPAQIAALTKLQARAPFKSWLALRWSVLRMGQPATADKAAADLVAMSDAEQDPMLKATGYSVLASFHHQSSRPEQAVAMYQKGLQIAPDDVNMLNNCAYIMSDKLKQHSDALPLARRAAELAPESAVVLDTLGTVQLGLRSCDEASSTLQKALDKARSDNERAAAMVHLARALQCQKKTSEAQLLRDELRKLFINRPELEQQFADDLKVLSQEIDGH